MTDFVRWMHAHNGSMPGARRTGFYGLDIYSLSRSIATVLGYLDSVNPAAAQTARERYGCLTAWQKDPAAYGRATMGQRYRDCEGAVVAQLHALLTHQLDYTAGDGERFSDAAQNAHLVAAAERYYRTIYAGPTQSWNQRDTHMFDTLTRLLETHDENTRAVVWAHNSHIGNAEATEMGRIHGKVSLGQLCRERFGDAAALVGFGTCAGTIAATHTWDAPTQVMSMPLAHEDSYEHQIHLAGVPRCLIDLRHGTHNALRARLREERLERFVGVVYQPG